MERLTSVDVCRGLAVICMALGDIPVLTDVGIMRHIGLLIAAPLFLFVAGVSYELFVISRRERQKNAMTRNIENFWKAIILLAITQGIFFLGVLLFPSKFSIGFNSSIFFVIAMGYLLSIVLPGKWIYQIPIILAPFLIFYLIPQIPLISSFLYGSPFQLIPLISYFLAGRGVMIFYENIHDFHLENGKILMVSAFVAASMPVSFQLLELPLPVTDTRTTILGFLWLAGVMIFTLSLVSVCSSKIRVFDIILSPFERIGRIAFSCYYAFYALELIVFPYLNRTFIIYLDPIIQVIAYYLFIVLTIIIAANIEKIWRKVGYIFGFEWALRYGSATLTKLTERVFAQKG